jgi:hypothetical protein
MPQSEISFDLYMPRERFYSSVAFSCLFLTGIICYNSKKGKIHPTPPLKRREGFKMIENLAKKLGELKDRIQKITDWL